MTRGTKRAAEASSPRQEDVVGRSTRHSARTQAAVAHDSSPEVKRSKKAPRIEPPGKQNIVEEVIRAPDASAHVDDAPRAANQAVAKESGREGASGLEEKAIEQARAPEHLEEEPTHFELGASAFKGTSTENVAGQDQVNELDAAERQEKEYPETGREGGISHEQATRVESGKIPDDQLAENNPAVGESQGMENVENEAGEPSEAETLPNSCLDPKQPTEGKTHIACQEQNRLGFAASELLFSANVLCSRNVNSLNSLSSTQNAALCRAKREAMHISAFQKCALFARNTIMLFVTIPF
jgi:hypothetical protein